MTRKLLSICMTLVALTLTMVAVVALLSFVVDVPIKDIAIIVCGSLVIQHSIVNVLGWFVKQL